MMNNRLPFYCALLSSILLSLSFFTPTGVFGAHIALLPLFFLLDRDEIKKRTFYSWIAGGLFFTILFYWIAVPVIDYGGSYRYLALPGMVVVCFSLGVFWALFALWAPFFLQKRRGFPLLSIPALWTLLEFLRTILFPPLPLGLLGHTQTQIPFLIQTADLFGTLGITFLVVFTNTFLFLLFTHRVKRKEVLLVLLFASTILVYGVLSMGTVEEENLLTLGIVQSNIPQEEKWDHNFQERNIQRHLKPTEEMALEVDLVIWPESAIPVDPYRHPHTWAPIAQTIKEIGVFVFTGILSFQNTTLYNSAFLLEDGEPTQRYNKLYLVPFGEYIPFSSLLFWVDTGLHSITPGEELQIFQYQDITLASPICYEILHTPLMRQMARDSDFLINLSNEAWFKNTHGLPLLFQILIMRTVELRRPIVKVANTGISGYVNARGEVIDVLPPFTFQYETVTVKRSTKDSLYMKYGDFPLILLLFIILAIPFLPPLPFRIKERIFHPFV